MNAAQYLELHLGRMESGWSSKSLDGVQVCLFRNQPHPGVLTLATLGLSNTVLSLNEVRGVRQELLLALADSEAPNDFAKLLLDLADQLRQRGRAILRGEVVQLQSAIAVNSPAAAVYASIPTAYPDELATLKDTTPPTVFVWLIPVLPAEAAFVQNSGWSEFESVLEATNPDLFNLRRDSVA